MAPMALQMQMIMPKASGSKPTAVATGYSSGTSMIMSGVPSMNMPPMRKMTVMIIMTTNGLCVNDVMASASMPGMFA